MTNRFKRLDLIDRVPEELWTEVCEIISLGFSRQENWSGLPFPSPGDLPDPGIKPVSPALAGRFFTTEPPGKFFLFYKCTNAVKQLTFPPPLKMLYVGRRRPLE